MTRSPRVHLAGRVSYRAAIEAFYAKRPEAAQTEVARATGAPRTTVRHVYDALVRSGRLTATRWKFARCSDR